MGFYSKDLQPKEKNENIVKDIFKESKSQKDLFGNVVETKSSLRDKYIEPPFSVFDAKSGNWQKRKQYWTSLGIKGEVGRSENLLHFSKTITLKEKDTSIFDPVLCELIYSWFCKENGTILDPFAGGSVRGIIAHYLGYKYVGIELRKEQIESNIEQAINILPENKPIWICGDSNQILDAFIGDVDMVFTCPPYIDLEKYSDLKEDLSNMSYPEFLIAYESIISKSSKLLKKNCFYCIVVGEVRDKNGYCYGFVADTIKIFQKLGLKLYNDSILLNSIGSASIRANKIFKNKKLVKIHQNVLIFLKPF